MSSKYTLLIQLTVTRTVHVNVASIIYMHLKSKPQFTFRLKCPRNLYSLIIMHTLIQSVTIKLQSFDKGVVKIVQNVIKMCLSNDAEINCDLARSQLISASYSINMNNLHSTWDNLHSWYYFAHNITQVSQNKIVLPKACLSSISNFVYSPSPTLHFECHFLLHRILSSGLLLDYWIMIPVICNFSHPKQQSFITDYWQCAYSIYCVLEVL